MKVILMGYMGSGKSTIGKALSNVIDYDFFDLDDYITEKEEKTIPQIFNEKGEIYFRKQEHHYLNELLNTKGDFVLSLGGGTPCYGNNMEAILKADDASSFYLKASIPFLANRLFEEKVSRPLINGTKSIEALEEFIGKHLFERGFYYNQAENVIPIDNKSKKDLVEELIFNLF